MKIAIVGFAGSGKSTVFKALTGFEKIASAKPALGTVRIEDEKLINLASIFKPKKITNEELVFVDLPGFNLAQAKEIESLMDVVGVFSGRDYAKDIDNMQLELMLSDLSIAEKRLSGLDKELRQTPSAEKEIEKKALAKCKESLDKNTPLREIKLGHDEERVISGFQFLTRKPVFILANLEENQLNTSLSNEIESYCKKKNLRSIGFCAKIEAEVRDLNPEERGEFIKALGLEQSALEKVLRIARDVLGLITFYTVKGDETKAWSVPAGTQAIDAAGKIHTDIKKGFIKAEVVGYNDLIQCGSLAEARSKGLLRLEGKEYIVKDGDIIDFKFNV